MIQEEINELRKKQEEFYRIFSDCPKPMVIPCLSLVLKKDVAIDILRGNKRFDWRIFSEFYVRKLCEEDFFRYADAHKDDEKFNSLSKYARYLKDVRRVHYHGCSGEWYMEVEVRAIHDIFATKEAARKLRERYNCHDLDAEAAYFSLHSEREPTEYLAIEIGNIIDTNLD